MKYLSGEENIIAMFYIKQAADIAKRATCERSKCGSVIVSLDDIIGIGFNSPAKDLEGQRRCSCSKDEYNKKVTDKTCCIHAEQRAIMDALRTNPDKLENSRLYFIRLNENDEMSKSGDPYCTICSKMALDVGISEFVLYDKKGICIYDTKEYNDLSYQFGKKNKI